MNKVTKGLYRHYKGGVYEVIEPCAIDTETGAKYVIYKGQNGTVWTRTIEAFTERIGSKGTLRFKKIE